MAPVIAASTKLPASAAMTVPVWWSDRPWQMSRLVRSSVEADRGADGAGPGRRPAGLRRNRWL
jgi:hypothetical protein